MKILSPWLLLISLAIFGSIAVADVPPYGWLNYQANSTGSMFDAHYFVPASPTGQYLYLYDGTVGIPTNNPAKLIGLGDGLTFDGTDLVNSGPTKSFAYPTRSLNTCFQLSSTRDAAVQYGVDVQTSISLTGGQTGTVYLRSYTNSSCTTGAQELNRFVNGAAGTLTLGLNVTQTVSGRLGGVIPAGLYAQLVTENTVGTPTFTARPGQEVLL